MARKGGSAEIAALKQAEAEAQLIVNQAREERKLKMRSAQQDAKREIDEYRAMRDAKLRSVQPEVCIPTATLDGRSSILFRFDSVPCILDRHKRWWKRSGGSRQRRIERLATSSELHSLPDRPWVRSGAKLATHYSRRAEYERTKDSVISMLMQVVLNINNPFDKPQ